MYDRYDIPIMVVENGLGAVDKIDSDGKIHDDYRIDYLKQHIEAMQKAIDDEGNGTLKRRPKDSFYWYKKVIESNGEDLGL